MIRGQVILWTILTAAGASPEVAIAESLADRPEIRWFAVPDATRFKVLGLPWFEANSPRLWRMPAKSMAGLPKGVQTRSKSPPGARIAFKSDTTRLVVRAGAVGGGALKRFDVAVDGRLREPSTANGDRDRVLFEGLDARPKEIVIYLPHLQETTIEAIGVDEGARIAAPNSGFARSAPVVFYGSSVCQGSAAVNPGRTYTATVCRELKLDFVNLGFGGAGKAEPNVVELVESVDACCYVFDLGKSYGERDGTAYEAMLRSVRKRRPDVPIVVITPITSRKEVEDRSYSAISLQTRKVMRESVEKRIKEGDSKLILVEGEDLLGFKDHALLSKDGVHPSDAGYDLIAKRLAPTIRKAIGR